MKRSSVLVRLGIVLVVAVLGLAAGCNALVGPEAAHGGSQGPQGPQGLPGEDGNANVVAAVADVTNADWGTGSYVYRHGQGTNTSRSARVVELAVPEITQEIYDFGMVHVFLKVPDTLSGPPASWAPLPYQYLAFGGGYYYNLAYTYSVGSLRLFYFHTTNDSGTAPPSPASITLPDKSFKYVVTAGQAIESMANEGVDPNDHDALMRYLGHYQ
jgi:hypothetical protein